MDIRDQKYKWYIKNRRNMTIIERTAWLFIFNSIYGVLKTNK